ncbi:GTPase-activating protein GYP5, partial [Zancudomyces culisetae]
AGGVVQCAEGVFAARPRSGLLPGNGVSGGAAAAEHARGTGVCGVGATDEPLSAAWLIEETMPLLAKHFTREGIQSSMYSSQWFMTLFACCLPMSLALRVFDLVFCEGADVLLQIALAVLKRAQPTLLTLRFESLVKYLSDGSLFTYYAQQPDDFLLADLNHITVVTTKRLAKLARDHAAVLAKADKISDTISALKAENARILRENSQMLATLQSLSTEHSDLSSQYINCKLDLQKANDTIAALNSRIDQLNQSLLTERRLAEDSLRVEMDTLAHKNLELTVQHESALEKIDYLEATLLKSNSQFVDSENQRLVLENKLLKMKKALS